MSVCVGEREKEKERESESERERGTARAERDRGGKITRDMESGLRVEVSGFGVGV